MEPTVQRLLNAEQDVRKMVKIAQDKKVAKLQNIKAESQADLDKFKEL